MNPLSATTPCVPTCTGLADCSCGCCAGISVQTPQREENLPGLSALAYRVGTWSSFKQSMLARLSSSDYPALQALKTRDDDDFTVAFLDASAMMLDVLTFYQERLANESYLRTAGQLRSLTELSRLIGYQPAPGVAASTYLAFSLMQAPGQPPDPAAPPITIPAGTRVQSVPPQGQKPQTFETAADIKAKPEWSALKVQTGSSWLPQTGDKAVYLAGTATQLQPGDLFLIVGDERSGSPANNNWDIRAVSTLAIDGTNNRTYLTWSEGLGGGNAAPAQANPKFFAFRQRAALFGYNAVNTNLIDTTQLTKIKDYFNSAGTDWDFFNSQNAANKNLDQQGIIDLDASYPKIVKDGWVALIHPDPNLTRTPPGFISLYRVATVATISRADFGLSAKISRVAADNNTKLTDYYKATRDTVAMVQSEELEVPEQPLPYPLYGTSVTLADRRTDLAGVQAIALTGKRQKVKLRDSVKPPQFTLLDGSSSRDLQPGEILILTEPPSLSPDASDWSSSTATPTFNVQDTRGRLGTVVAPASDFMLAASGKDDPTVSEYARVSSVDTTSNTSYTQLLLQSALTYCYDRAATTVNANVGLATNGQSVSELLGNGNASTPNQSFTTKQSPLTYTQASTPTGRATTLEVKVNGVKWTAVASLYNQPPAQTVYATQNQPDGTATILFGDGVEGAVLPTGQSNVQATYRVGSGLAGNVGGGTLTTLMDRPLGVSGVSNPQAATGGQDPQSVDDIRANAPQTVLTLGRAVSVTDYQNFASSFAGIAKAYALWIPGGPGRGVFLTVAGAGGAALQAGDPTLANLITALHSYGNPLIPITAVSFVETLFSFSADVLYDSAYDQPTVESEVRQTLSQTFGFAARAFGQAVGIDEISTVIQSIDGVLAVNVKGLNRGLSSTGGDLAALGGYANVSVLNAWTAKHISLNRPFADPPGRLCAFIPVADPLAVPQPAEILVIDPDPRVIVLGLLS